MTKEENELSKNELDSLRNMFTPGIIDGSVKIKPLKNGDVRITHPLKVDGEIQNVTRILTGEEAALILGLKNLIDSGIH